jgi:hypothetical protein
VPIEAHDVQEIVAQAPDFVVHQRV